MSASREAFRFMLDNAGYVVGRRAQGALELARAESLLHRAIDGGAARIVWEDDTFELREDDTFDMLQGIEDGRYVGPAVCLLYVGDDVAASLGGIVVSAPTSRGDDPYVRVVEAELASEAADDLRQALGDALDCAQGIG